MTLNVFGVWLDISLPVVFSKEIYKHVHWLPVCVHAAEEEGARHRVAIKHQADGAVKQGAAMVQ